MSKYIAVRVRGSDKAKRYELKKSSTIKVQKAESIDVFAQRTDVTAMEQQGNDLVIRFSDGIVTRLQDYFLCNANEQPDLNIVDAVARQSLDVSFENGTCGASAGTAQTLAYTLTPASDGYASGFLPVAGGIGLGPLLGLGGLLGGGAAVAGGGGGGGGDDGGTPVDQTPPTAPVLAPTNGVTITGTAEPGSKVTLDLDGNGTGDATVDVGSSGSWTYTPTAPIPNGTTITGTATDPAGNTSGPGTTVVDAATTVPTIAAVTDDVGLIVGTVGNGGSTDDKRPAISGTGAEAGATVAVFDGGVQIGTTTASASGNWSFTPTSDLGEGPHSFTARGTDSLGNTSAASAPYVVVVDTTAPAAPVLDPSDGTELTGTAEPGTQVNLDLDGDGDADVSVPVDDAGDWSYTPEDPIPDGTTVTGTAQDPAGNTSGPGSTTIDSDGPPVDPTAPVIQAVTDDVGTVTGVIAKGGVTDDTRPRISGTGAAANATVTVFDGATQLGTTTADASGNWGFVPANPLPQGSHNFTATSGTSGPSAVYGVTIDTTPPAPPIIAPTDGSPVTGTAEPGSTVRLDIDGNGTLDVNVPTDGTGNWSYTPPTPIPDGTTVTARAVDPAGNVSGPATAVVDADGGQQPAAPTISSVTDDVGSVVGTLANGGVTDDTRPLIAGSGAAANATVSVYDGSVLLGTTTANASGNWSFTPPTALGQGGHSFSATVTTGQGTSPNSAVFAVMVDTTPPAAPIINPTDGSAVTGTAEPGSTVRLDVDGNGTVDVSVPANGSGNWSYTPPTAIPDGTTITARAVDAAGNTSGPANAVVDADTPPPAPVIGAVIDDVAPVTGTVANGGNTDDTLPQISGSGAEPGATVTVFDGATQLGTTTASGTGTWNFTPSTPLTAGSHSFTARVTDSGGTTGPSSGAYVVTVIVGDTTPPVAPTIGGVTDDVAPVIGNVANGGTTDDTQPLLTGSGAEAGSTVTVFDGATQLGTAIAGPSGNWTFTPSTPLGAGQHSFTATVTDSAGNTGPASAPYTITVVIGDTTPPAIPTISGVTDDVAPTTGNVADGGTTDDPLPTLSGTAEAGSTVRVFDGLMDLGTATANGSGNWTFTPSTPLTGGSHSFTVTATDNAGNTSQPSVAYDINLVLADTTPPPVPTIGAVTDDVLPLIGTVPDGGTTNDATPTITGTAEAGSTVTLFNGSTEIGTAVASGNGNWTFTPSSPLANGTYAITATATDGAGNESGASAAYDFTVSVPDTTPPLDPIILAVTDDVLPIVGVVLDGATTNDPLPAITGTAEAGATVTLFNGATELGTTVAGILGTWTFTPSAPLVNGTYAITATATDGAGNTSGASAAYGFTVAISDTTPPPTPTIDTVTDDVLPTIGTVPDGGTTNDPLPVITGTAEAGATVTLFNGAAELGTTVAGILGTWVFTPSSPLANGTYAITATATDGSGNESGASAAYDFTVTVADTTAPLPPLILTVTDDVLPVIGLVLDGGTTNDTTPTITGTAEAGSTVTLFDGSTELGTAIANGLGAWTFTPSSPLPGGAYAVTATATDTAGNESSASAAYGFTVVVTDTTPPSAPTITSVVDDVLPGLGTVPNGGVTNDTVPTVNGSGAEPGATVTVFDGEDELGTTIAGLLGNWSFTPSSPLPQGDHSFTATVTDTAGNTGDASGAWDVTIFVPDTTPPPAPVITGVADDVAPGTGNVLDGGTTDDPLPVISGTAEAGSTVTVFDDGDELGTATANGSGNWTFTPSSPLTGGAHVFTATATDGAGNTGAVSNAYDIDLVITDVTAPPAPSITGVADDVAPTIGNVVNGGTTNDTVPVISGTAEAGSTVTVFNNGAELGTATTNGAGNWTFTPPAPLVNGSYSFTATATDGAGNTGLESNPYEIIVSVPDTTAPTQTVDITAIDVNTGATNDFTTEDTSPIIRGTVSAALAGDEFVEVRVDGGAWERAQVSGTSWFRGVGTLSAANHTVEARVIDAANNQGSTDSQQITITAVNDPPIAFAANSDLLGLVGAEVLGLLQIGEQSVTAFDPDGNLASVTVTTSSVLGLGGTLTASAALASELGLTMSITPGGNILVPTTTISISAGTNPLTNQAVNEVLSTVHFQSIVNLLGVDLGTRAAILGATEIAATDTLGGNDSSSFVGLINLDVLSSSGAANVKEDLVAGGNTVQGNGTNERLYGHDGNDTLLGAGGNDLLRGGAGADILRGEAGNDVLVFDAADTVIDGGADFDVLLIDNTTSGTVSIDGSTVVNDIERIHLGYNDGGRSLTLNAAGVAAALGSGPLIITGDGEDSVTLTGAIYQGQIEASGNAFDIYEIGASTVRIDAAITVFA